MSETRGHPARPPPPLCLALSSELPFPLSWSRSIEAEEEGERIPSLGELCSVVKRHLNRDRPARETQGRSREGGAIWRNRLVMCERARRAWPPNYPIYPLLLGTIIGGNRKGSRSLRWSRLRNFGPARASVRLAVRLAMVVVIRFTGWWGASLNVYGRRTLGTSRCFS